jgi:PE family
MSFLNTTPEFVSAAATDLASIGANLDGAHAAAATPTTAILAAGGDEVSEGVATLFGAQARAYQALSAQAATFHQQFVQLMNAGAGTYASTEATNGKPLQNFEATISQDEATISRDIELQNRLISEAVAKLDPEVERVLTDEEQASKALLKSTHDALFNAISSLATIVLAQEQKAMESLLSELQKI